MIASVNVNAHVGEHAVTEECIVADGNGAVVFDPRLTPDMDRRWLSTEYWRCQGRFRSVAGGRGGVSFIDTPTGEGVLRHYQRGGSVAKLLGDRYLWTGAARTRSFREFRLLRRLRSMALPVPEPLAAGYVRHALQYTADLITCRIEGAVTLAECLAEGECVAELAAHVGATVALFHRRGVYHADLNAHNVMLTADQVSLIDFDRGRIRKPAPGWQQANLRRLHRSLLKLGAAGSNRAEWEKNWWQALLSSHASRVGKQ